MRSFVLLALLAAFVALALSKKSHPKLITPDKVKSSESGEEEDIQEEIAPNELKEKAIGAGEGAGAVQGDEMIEKSRRRRNALTKAQSYRKWPKSSNGLVYVPYIYTSPISSSPAHMKAIQATFAAYADVSCIRFVPRKSEQYYIKFISDGGCYSYVGRSHISQQPQPVSLANGCQYKSTVEHELLHALGFNHEQCRPDRDTYLKIFLNNVQSSQRHNFDKAKDSTTQGLAYDPFGVMQYDETAFGMRGSNGRPMRTMEAIASSFPGIDVTHLGPKNEPFGDWDALDIKKLNTLYECDPKAGGGGDAPQPPVIPETKIETGPIKRLDLQVTSADISTFMSKVNRIRSQKGDSAIKYDTATSKKLHDAMWAKRTFNCGGWHSTVTFYDEIEKASTAFERFTDMLSQRPNFALGGMSSLACGILSEGVRNPNGGSGNVVMNKITCIQLFGCGGDTCRGRRSNIDPDRYCSRLSFAKGSSFATDACKNSYYQSPNGTPYYPYTCCKTWGTC